MLIIMQTFSYSTVQLQLHIITHYHAYQRAKSLCVPRRGFACLTSMVMSN